MTTWLPPQGSTELSHKAVFRERMHLLGQSAATPILHLFEVSALPKWNSDLQILFFLV